MINKIFSYSRYITVIAVLCCFIAGTTLSILAGIETFQLVRNAFTTSLDALSIKALAITFLEVIDILLLGTVFYITSLGLYELFIDEKLPTPAWLHIEHLDDLKSILLSVIVVILAVVFVGQVAKWDGERNLLVLGGAIGFVIIAITFFLGWRSKKD
jgi:uncharacterized membrane protein YqhA